VACKKYQSEYKEFKKIIDDIMEQRKFGISTFDKEIKRIEDLEKNEVIL